jgi:hypothetical protein
LYKLVSVGRAKGGKVREAIMASKGIAEYIGKHDIKIDAYIQQFGPSGTIYLMGEQKDLASIQALQARLIADEGYWALLQKAAEVLDPPTMALLQQV